MKISTPLTAFLFAVAVIGSAQALDDAIGRALFKRAWVPAPSSTKANAGLGPLFNARSCLACHRDLNRGPVAIDENGRVTSDNLVIRLSDRNGRPDPMYGKQLQTSAVSSNEPEGYVLRLQAPEPAGLRYGSLAPTTRAGALVAPALRGLGLLEAIPDDVIVAQLDEPRGGVGGRVNWVTDASGKRRVGRFGWKASQATLREQTETAFLLDLGLSTSGRMQHPGDCTGVQPSCIVAPHGGSASEPEMSDEIVSRVVSYLGSIAPPQPKTGDHAGLKLFSATGCVSCHRPTLPGPKGPVAAFTDLLLHDMGQGLDGGATESGVASTEWRTAPLWGLSYAVRTGAGLLHDSRAASVEEAIVLHGGDAAPSRLRFEALPLAERRKLIDFLETL
jgi:CxxC motif-containing protein (DUF1111 family)